MATKTKPATSTKTEKPAVKKPATTEKPAVKAVVEGVGIKDLAADLGKEPRSVRASIRRLKGGAQVGQGGRYSWASKSDPEYKELLSELSKSSKSKGEDKEDA